MTNLEEEIIKCAISGGYKKGLKVRFDLPIVWFTKKGKSEMLAVNDLICDPLFWEAIGRAKGWGVHSHVADALVYSLSATTGKTAKPDWLKHALNFMEINLTQGWQPAIEYLYSLISNKGK